MRIRQCALCIFSPLLLAAIAFGQEEYVGRYDAYAGFMYLDSPLIGLGETGYHLQAGFNPTTWYSMGVDFSAGTGDTTLVPSMLKSLTQQQISSQLTAAGIPSSFALAVPMHSSSQTYAIGPQVNYRHFHKLTLFIHPDVGVIHEDATPHVNDSDTLERIVTTMLIAQMAPSGSKEDYVWFYGFGGGFDYNMTQHVGLKVHVDFVHDHLFPDMLNGRNSVRMSIGPVFHMGHNVAQ